MPNPFKALRDLLTQKESTVSRVVSGTGETAVVTGNLSHPQARPGDTLLRVGGRVIRLPPPPPPIRL